MSELPCRVGLAPVGIRRSIRSSRSRRLHASPRWVHCPLLHRQCRLAQESHTSSVAGRGLVSVPEPTVSRPGFAPGHLLGRWGDFPHTQLGTGTGLPLPPTRKHCIRLSRSIGPPTWHQVRYLPVPLTSLLALQARSLPQVASSLPRRPSPTSWQLLRASQYRL